MARWYRNKTATIWDCSHLQDVSCRPLVWQPAGQIDCVRGLSPKVEANAHVKRLVDMHVIEFDAVYTTERNGGVPVPVHAPVRTAKPVAAVVETVVAEDVVTVAEAPVAVVDVPPEVVADVAPEAVPEVTLEADNAVAEVPAEEVPEALPAMPEALPEMPEALPEMPEALPEMPETVIKGKKRR